MSNLSKIVFNENLLSLFLKGGILMLPLLIMSIVSIFIFFERVIFLRKSNIFFSKEKFAAIKNRIEKNDIDSVQEIFKINKEIIKNIFIAGIDEYKNEKSSNQEIEIAMSNALAFEIKNMEYGLDILSSIYNLAPQIGFLGTIIGMLISFMNISNSDEIISMKYISSGIYEAMISTAFGLIVSIVTFVIHDFVLSRVKKNQDKMEFFSNLFFNFLKKNKNDKNQK
jgi:biopolymer transport protein ExbB